MQYLLYQGLANIPQKQKAHVRPVGEMDYSVIDLRTFTYPYGKRKKVEALPHDFLQSNSRCIKGLSVKGTT